MGRDAIEAMWVTEATEPQYYETRAESHGCIYRSRLEIDETSSGSKLTMSFYCQPEKTSAKFMWLLPGRMAKKSLEKAIAQDLEDIKKVVGEA